MENAMVLAEHGRALNRRMLGRLAVFTAGVAVLFALALLLFQQQAEAQINIQQFVCPLLINLRNTLGAAFGAFVLPIINALLAAFGCVISGG